MGQGLVWWDLGIVDGNEGFGRVVEWSELIRVGGRK